MGTLAISYTYDNNGNIITMTDGTGTTTRTYDALNRTTSKTVPDIGTSFYVYDITAGMDEGCTAETTTDPKGNITLKVYDPLGRLSRVTADGMTSAYTYYDNGSLQTVLYGDGSREDYTYTAENLLQTLTNRKADDTIIDSYAYTYDAAHNLLTKTDSRGITSYTYDVLNRLSSVTEPSGKLTSYTYDASGNRATQTVVLGTETTVTAYTYDPLNRLLGTVTQLNGITTESVTYTYDNNGNQLLQTHIATIDGIPQTPIVKLANTYDLFNRLITTVTADGVTVISTYNGDGLRVGKSVNGTLTRYLYEYQRVVLEVNSLGDQTGRNVYGINLLTRQVGVDTFLYMYNGHADVTALLNTAGNVVATYYYDAFGNIIDQTGVLSNNILYAGYQYDTETGLYYLNARMYDPVTARFMQEDSFTGDRNDPLSLNLYTYCHNEPLMYSDPTGHKDYKPGESTAEYYRSQGEAALKKKALAKQQVQNQADFDSGKNLFGMPTADYANTPKQKNIAYNAKIVESQKAFVSGNPSGGVPADIYAGILRSFKTYDYVSQLQHDNETGVEVNAAGKLINEELFLEVLANTDYMSPELQAFYQAIPGFYGAVYGSGESTTQCDCGGLARGIFVLLDNSGLFSTELKISANGEGGDQIWQGHEPGRTTNRMFYATDTEDRSAGTTIYNSPFYKMNANGTVYKNEDGKVKIEDKDRDTFNSDILQPGDIIYYDSNSDGCIDHASIYVGETANGDKIIYETGTNSRVHFGYLEDTKDEDGKVTDDRAWADE